MRNAILLAVLFLLPTATQADTLAGHAFRMARRGAIWHDRHRGGGSEVVARVKPGLGQRARAIAAWRRSRPHAAILRAPGRLRIRCIRGFCVGRK